MAQLDRIESSLGAVGERLTGVERRLDVYNAHLQEHMRRTELLEDEVKGFSSHRSQWMGAGKAAGFLATLLGIVTAIWRFFP